MKKKFAAAMLGLSILGGCAQTRLSEGEEQFNTGGPITRLYHSALYYPSEIAPKYDGYLVGIEKSPREKIMVESDLHLQAIEDSGLSLKKLEDKLSDGKLLYVSHIIKTHGNAGGVRNCAVFNAYGFNETEQRKQLTTQCTPDSTGIWPINQAYKNSWTALDQLGQSLSKDLDAKNTVQYSSIVVVVMGWNTTQEQSVRNVNSIVSNLKLARGEQFNPLVIAVSWPSQWNSAWLDPFYKLLSFGTKANDADELGYTWLGVLLHQTIPKYAPGKEFIVIGHSFGARATSVASCVGPAIYRDTPNLQRTTINHLINFQGAYMASRLFSEQDKGINYPKGCENVKQFVLTSSDTDTANSLPFWGDYSGSINAYVKQCSIDAPLANCACADATGKVSVSKPGVHKNLFYVNASNITFENAYDTGGGSHSDIYRREHGAFISGMLDNKYEVGICVAPKSVSWIRSVM